MAEFPTNLVLAYFPGGTAGELSLAFGGASDGVADNGEPDQTIESGDEIGNNSVFYGTIEVDGIEFLVVGNVGETLFDGGALIANVPNPDTFLADNPDFPTTLQVASDTTLDDPTFMTYPEGSGFVVCFAAGTAIATPDGERLVEALDVGDLVITADGRSVPVKWVGRQTVVKHFTPSVHFCPVQIKAGALGEYVPHTDLIVTGDHGIVVGDVMVNAAALVNGTTITRVPADDLPERVTYWHIETEHHDVIVASGAPAETFVDSTTRRRFDNYAQYVALFGEPDSRMPVLPYARATGPRQLPGSVHTILAERAAALGATKAAA